MARHLRIEYPGAVYHVVSRGNARQELEKFFGFAPEASLEKIRKVL